MKDKKTLEIGKYLLTKSDIDMLAHTQMGSFLSQQPERFEVVNDTEKEITKDYTYEMSQEELKKWWLDNEKECSIWYFGTQLEWIMAYNYLTYVDKIKCEKLIDLAAVNNEEVKDDEMFVLIINKKYE